MGKLQLSLMDHLEPEHYRVMTALELGHRNHQLVPMQIISIVAKIQRGGCKKYLDDLVRHKLVSFEKSQKVCGYRLTMQGYDILTINTLMRRDSIKSVGRTIGCGKESYVYEAFDTNNKPVVLKIHRLGQTCFRSLKRNRDYLSKRHAASWIYLSRLSALKEFAHQKMLHQNGFPVPAVLAHNRNAIVMDRIDGLLMNDIGPLSQEEADNLANELIDLITRFAQCGLIHCDFNEFNILIAEGLRPFVIDFPQMVSVRHANASLYFERDVRSIRDFFSRRFKMNVEAVALPDLDVISLSNDLDKQLKISGFNDGYGFKGCEMLSKPLMSGTESVSSEEEEEDGEISDLLCDSSSCSSADDRSEGGRTLNCRREARPRTWTVAMAQKKLSHERRVTNRQRLKKTLSSVARDCYRAEHKGKESRHVRAEILAELNERH